MSLRDWFAGQAMKSIIAKLPLQYTTADEIRQMKVEIARGACGYADAMLAELKKP